MALFSYSRIGTYFNCPAQYEFRYIRRVPSPSPEGVELFLGSRFHEAMEFLYGELPKRVPSLEEILDSFQDQWEAKWAEAQKKQKTMGYSQTLRVAREGTQPLDYRQKGRDFLERYYRNYHPFNQDATEGIETKVVFDLDPGGRYKMQGYIDRLARDAAGVLWVHDYKTSSKKLSVEEAKGEDQLALYQLGLLQHPRYGKYTQVKLAWHFVAFDEDLVQSERTAKDLDFLKKKYVAKIDTIEKAKTFSTKTGPLCAWCEYLPLCEDGKAWTGSRKKKEGLPGQERAAKPQAPGPGETPAALPQAPVSVPVPAGLAPGPGRKKKAQAPSKDQLPLF